MNFNAWDGDRRCAPLWHGKFNLYKHVFPQAFAAC